LAIFVDTHCHLNFNSFEADLGQVLERAWKAGIERILMPGVDVETSRQVIKLSERDPRLFAAVGVHPNDALSWDESTREELCRMAKHPRVLAIGEIGLDYYRDRAPHELQKEILGEQLGLAAETGKPVLIHSRQSLPELWPILANWQTQLDGQHPLAKQCGVLHSYEGDLATALAAVKQGFFIGIGGPVTFRNAPERQILVASLPLEAMLLETDAPFLAPHPYRGRRNEPAYIPVIAEKIAGLHSQPLEVIAEVTFTNADRLLGWR
jgi:TatD DNase family protein